MVSWLVGWLPIVSVHVVVHSDPSHAITRLHRHLPSARRHWSSSRSECRCQVVALGTTMGQRPMIDSRTLPRRLLFFFDFTHCIPCGCQSYDHPRHCDIAPRPSRATTRCRTVVRTIHIVIVTCQCRVCACIYICQCKSDLIYIYIYIYDPTGQDLCHAVQAFTPGRQAAEDRCSEGYIAACVLLCITFISCDG